MKINKRRYETIRSSRPGALELLEKPRNPIYVIANDIRSLYNVGSIFRSSDAAGIKKLFLTGISGYPPRKEISKTAIGAEDSVPWEYHKNVFPVLEYMKSEKIPIVALEHANKSILYTKSLYRFPLCLIVGNEVEGISNDILEYADFAVEIPMYGKK